MTIVPRPAASIPGSTPRTALNAPARLIWTPRAQASGSASAIIAIGSITPALFTSTSTGPSRVARLAHQPLDRAVIRHVARRRGGLPAIIGNAPRHLRRSRAIPRRQHDGRARARQRHRGGLADAAAGPGHDRRPCRPAPSCLRSRVGGVAFQPAAVILPQLGLQQLAGRGVRQLARRSPRRRASTISRFCPTGTPASRLSSRPHRASDGSAAAAAPAISDGAPRSPPPRAPPDAPRPRFSISIEPIHSPPDFTTSLARSVICT